MPTMRNNIRRSVAAASDRYMRFCFIILVLQLFISFELTECKANKKKHRQQQMLAVTAMENSNPGRHNDDDKTLMMLPMNNDTLNDSDVHNDDDDDDDDSNDEGDDVDADHDHDGDVSNTAFNVDDRKRVRGRSGVGRGGGHRRKHQLLTERNTDWDDEDISLWISEQQLQMITALFFPQAFTARIYAIDNGHVVNGMREMDIYKYLVIPAEVSYVNFTWKSGPRKYFYHFDRLHSFDKSILKSPTLSIKAKGRIPAQQKNFSIFLPCAGNISGTAMFNVGLSIQNRRGKPLPGTPLRLTFKKECTPRRPDPNCSTNCDKNGFCNHLKICQCKVGYTGQNCQSAFCFPQCMNGGNCTEPSVCTCPMGYQGPQCEGGICSEKCLNGGKCIQKDECHCSKGYYGPRCEFSKCVIPCKNGGRCIGNNVCRCPEGLHGNHCEIGRKQRSTCKCKNGVCKRNKTCKCNSGFYGRRCNGRIKKYPRVTVYK